MNNHQIDLPREPLPDFNAMTKEEVGQWLMTHDTSELMHAAALGVDRDIQHVESLPPSVVTAVRLPAETLVEIGRRVHPRDREGRSGLIRAALAEYFERHPRPAA